MNKNKSRWQHPRVQTLVQWRVQIIQCYISATATSFSYRQSVSEKNAILETVMLAWPAFILVTNLMTLIQLAKLEIFRIWYFLASSKSVITLWYETNWFNTDLFYTSYLKTNQRKWWSHSTITQTKQWSRFSRSLQTCHGYSVSMIDRKLLFCLFMNIKSPWALDCWLESCWHNCQQHHLLQIIGKYLFSQLGDSPTPNLKKKKKWVYPATSSSISCVCYLPVYSPQKSQDYWHTLYHWLTEQETH